MCLGPASQQCPVLSFSSFFLSSFSFFFLSFLFLLMRFISRKPSFFTRPKLGQWSWKCSFVVLFVGELECLDMPTSAVTGQGADETQTLCGRSSHCRRPVPSTGQGCRLVACKTRRAFGTGGNFPSSVKFFLLVNLDLVTCRLLLSPVDTQTLCGRSSHCRRPVSSPGQGRRLVTSEAQAAEGKEGSPAAQHHQQ